MKIKKYIKDWSINTKKTFYLKLNYAVIDKKQNKGQQYQSQEVRTSEQ